MQYERAGEPRAAIGLHLCRRIASLHGGRLRVAHGTLEGTSTIELELPC